MDDRPMFPAKAFVCWTASPLIRIPASLRSDQVIMAKTRTLSLAELKNLVEDRKKRLDELKKQKIALQKELDSVAKEIAKLEGKSGRRKRSSGKKKKVRRRRAKNEKPLKAYVTAALKRKKKGASLQEIHDHVLAAGYTSNSDNFKNVIYQCLYNNKEFVHNGDKGTYKLK
jgi:predicted nuclease with TOPRIM domain